MKEEKILSGLFAGFLDYRYEHSSEFVALGTERL